MRRWTIALEGRVLGVRPGGSIDGTVEPLVLLVLRVLTVTAAILRVAVAQQGHEKDEHREHRGEYHTDGHHGSAWAFVGGNVVAIPAMRLPLGLEYLLGQIYVAACPA